MLKKPITYTDFNNVKRTKDFLFNLTKAEILEMEVRTKGGLETKMKTMSERNDGDEIMTFFKDLLFRSYGEKSDDGQRFVKSEELSIAFSQTGAYDVLFVELVTDPEKAAAFFNAIIPEIPKLPEETK